MSLCAVSFPKMTAQDFDWIQGIRRMHDRLFFEVVAPHLTLIFPTDGIDDSTLIAHVAAVAARTRPFEVVFRRAILGDPDFINHAHAFLIPDEGFGEVVGLHDELYTGPLRSHLRLDLPFIPHMGVASTLRVSDCIAIVDRLNCERLEIRARVEDVDVIGYDGHKTWTIEKYPLVGEGP